MKTSKKIIKTISGIFGICWTIIVIIHAFRLFIQGPNYNLSSGDGIGGILGILAGIFIISIPGLIALKTAFVSPKPSIKEKKM